MTSEDRAVVSRDIILSQISKMNWEFSVIYDRDMCDVDGV